MSQPSYTRRNTCGAALLRRMSARVLTTREKPALPCTGFHTGAPSIGTSIAGALPTITRGTGLATTTVCGLSSTAASDICSRSSDTDA